MKTRSHFEHDASQRITTIIPPLANGAATLAESGWIYRTRTFSGYVVRERDADEVANAIRAKTFNS